jgi:hypothetical protein
MLQHRHQSALKTILATLSGHDILWAFTGSTSFALQGMPLTPSDIDVQTDQPGAYEVERLLQDFVTRPVKFSSTGTIRSHFGELTINGVKVEIIGDVQHHLPDRTWSPPPDLRQAIHFVEWAGLTLPVLSLEHEEDAYQKLGRPNRASQIRQWLKNQNHA